MSQSNRKEKIKTGFWKFIREMIPVMLGVYFAFALSDFSEQRKTNAEFAEYKMLLKKEVTQNLERIIPNFKYHENLKEDLISLARSEQPYKAFQDYNMQGLRTGFVSSSAYKTGIQTGIIQEFDLDMIQNINNLYTYQDNYEDYNKGLLNGFINKDIPENDKEVMSMSANLLMSMNDVIIFENNLIEYYNLLLDNINNN